MNTHDLFRSAMLHVCRNLDRAVTIREVAQTLGVSEDQLTVAFHDVADTTPGKLIRRLRAEQALRTLQDRNMSVLETALASGFEDHSAFSRSFKRSFGFAPSGARDRRTIQRDLEHIQLEDPDMVELLPLHLQIVTVEGNYFDCATEAWTRLIHAMREKQVEMDAPYLWIGRALDDPHHQNVAPDRVRFMAGVEGVGPDLGLERLEIPSCDYARFRFAGKPSNMGLAFHYIYGSWAETANRHPSSIPALIIFDQAPDGNDALLDISICVPLQTR